MKSIKRGERLTILLIILFLIGMVVLVVKIVTQATFYMSHSNNVNIGCVYDRNGDKLFDPNATVEEYGADYFLDIGNVIGDDSGQMTNTLVSENIDDLQNYNLLFGAVENGKSAIYTTLDHDANQSVYNAFGSKNGTAIAYNYKTGEILICVSKPSVNILDYQNVENLETGSLLCKAFYETVPGSTQKVSTLAAAIETIGYDAVTQKSYNCEGTYYNHYNHKIVCHKLSGHGWQSVSQAFQNSCNPWFAQLVQDLPLEGIQQVFRNMGYQINGEGETTMEIDGITCFTASTELTDVNDFDTQWGCMGQSKTVVSPCQLMMWESAIANGTGKVTQPYFISYKQNLFGTIKDKAQTEYLESIFSADTAQKVKAIMRENGDAKYASINYPVGVKSGTAQVKNGKEENSLLSGFCDDNSLPIAFCVVIEDYKESDGISTSQIVRTMLNALSS